MTENVLLCGYHKHVQPYYETADIFVCPSDTEGLSNVILEAMAFSIPVIATNVGGNPEIVVHEKNGLLVPPKDSSALANAVKMLISEPDRRMRYGRSGFDTVTKAFTFEMRTLKIQELYQKLIQRKG